MRLRELRSPGEGGGEGRKPPIDSFAKGRETQGKKMLKMLHVEDEPQIRSMVLRIAKGVADTGGVKQAESAEEALGMLGKNDDFDIILLDLRMPGMGGIGFVRKLLGDNRQDLVDKIVITSGTAQDIGLGSGAEDIHGAVGGRVLVKPVEAQTLSNLFKFASDGWEVQYWAPPERG
jgi:CheY-like chemotaxis protein